MAKPKEDGYKRKAGLGGWILLGVLVITAIIQAGNIRLNPMQAKQQNPEDALQQYTQLAASIMNQQTVGQTTIDELLALVSEEDRKWFEENYKEQFRIISRAEGGPGAAADPEMKSRVVKYLVEKGLHTSAYEVKSKKDIAKSSMLDIITQEGKRMKVKMIKENGFYYVGGFAGGR